MTTDLEIDHQASTGEGKLKWISVSALDLYQQLWVPLRATRAETGGQPPLEAEERG